MLKQGLIPEHERLPEEEISSEDDNDDQNNKSTKINEPNASQGPKLEQQSFNFM